MTGAVFDVSTAAILAAVAWLEGIRQVPEGGLLVQRSFFSEWRVLPARGSGRYWIPIGWAPVVTTLVLTVPDTPPEREGDSSALVRPSAFLEFALAALGVLALFTVVLGIPYALGSFGTAGFILAVGSSFALSMAVSLVAFMSGHKLGMTTGAALKWAARFLSPFAAPRASEELMQKGLDGIAPGRVLEYLLCPRAFQLWLRPLLYDLRHDPTQAQPRLLAGLDIDGIGGGLASVDLIETGATSYCPRCGGSFVRGDRCPDCHVKLEPASSFGPP